MALQASRIQNPDGVSYGGPRYPSLFAGELSEERKRRMIDAVAEWVVDKGMEVPATMFLEMHRPLATMASVGYAFVQPPLAMMFGFGRTEEIRLLLSDPECVTELLSRIEAKSRERKGGSGPEAGGPPYPVAAAEDMGGDAAAASGLGAEECDCPKAEGWARTPASGKGPASKGEGGAGSGCAGGAEGGRC